MKVVSIINYKGGVGKTTLTANLGAYAAMKGYRVLLVDLDPQTHLTFSFMSMEQWRDRYKETKTLKNYFDCLIDSKPRISLSSLAIPLNYSPCRKFDLLSSHLSLADMDMKLSSICSGSNFSLVAGNSLRMYNYLNTGLEELKSDYDLVLIDCSPNFNALVRNAAVASDYYLVPVRLDYLSSLGMKNLKASIFLFLNEYGEFQKARPDLEYKTVSLEMLGVVPMMVQVQKDVITAQKEYMSRLQEEGHIIFPYVRNSFAVFSLERTEKGPVVLTEKRYFATKSAQQSPLFKVVNELFTLGDEFLKRINLQN